MNDLIAKIDFFSGLDDKILRKISEACIVRQFTRNETIVRQGEMGLGLYVIAKGRVRVDREQGGVRTQMAELGPEQFFGEMSLLDNKPRSATAPVPASTNGAVPAAADSGGTKAQIRARLLETFESLYTLKALSRFSVAVLGCPVEGVASNVVDEIRVGDVKALIFPAGEAVV